MPMKAIQLILVLTLCAPVAHAQLSGTASPKGQLTGQERRDLYLHETYLNPLVPVRNMATAGLAQWLDSPPEWGQGARGFGRRAGHRLARLVIRNSYEAAGAALLGHDVRYFASESTRVLPRIRHAVLSTFLTYDRRGHRTVPVARIASVIATEYTSLQWVPEQYRTNRQMVRGVAIDFGAGCAFRIVREFSPEIRRLFRR